MSTRRYGSLLDFARTGVTLVGVSAVGLTVAVGLAMSRPLPGASSPRRGTSAGTVMSSVAALPSLVSASSASGPAADVVAQLAGRAFDLTYDATRRAVWFTTYASAGDYLNKYDIATGSTTRWPMPEGGETGDLTETRIAPDGSVWATGTYRLFRFDPVSARLTTFDFAADVPATPPNPRNPGTWLSAIAFDASGNAYVTRNNIASLTVVSPTMHLLASVPLPIAYAGPGSVAVDGDAIFVTPPDGDSTDPVLVLDHAGAILGRGPEATHLAALSTGGPILSFGNGSVDWLAIGSQGAALTVSHLPGLDDTGYFDRGAITPDGTAVLYLQGERAVVEVNHGGEQLAKVAIPYKLLTISNPLGGQVQAKYYDSPIALAADSAGGAWYVTASGELIRITF